MAFDNLTDKQVRDIVEGVGGFFNNLQVKALLEAADAIAGGEPLTANDIPNLSAAKITTGTFAAARLPNATTAARGVVLQCAAQANSTATDVAGLVADFNAFLTKQRTAGQLA